MKRIKHLVHTFLLGLVLTPLFGCATPDAFVQGMDQITYHNSVTLIFNDVHETQSSGEPKLQPVTPTHSCNCKCEITAKSKKTCSASEELDPVQHMATYTFSTIYLPPVTTTEIILIEVLVEAKADEGLVDKLPKVDPVDPSGSLGIIKLLLLPFLLWSVTGISKYFLTRIHLVRVLKSDMQTRLKLAPETFKSFQVWASNLKEKRSLFQPPSFWGDKHEIFESSLYDIRACLWGNEVDAVLAFYRDQDQVSQNLTQSQEIGGEIKSFIKEKSKGVSLKDDIPTWLSEAIDSHVADVKSRLELWWIQIGKVDVWDDGKKVINEKNITSANAEKIVGMFFWSSWTFSLVFFLLPISTLSLSTFFVISRSDFLKEFSPEHGLVGSIFAGNIFLFIVLRIKVNKSIEDNILRLLHENLQDRRDQKEAHLLGEPLSLVKAFLDEPLKDVKNPSFYDMASKFASFLRAIIVP